jgi:hypothetical protein
MKVVTFARRWRRRLDETTVEEFPKGATATVNNDRAAAALKAGVLDGEPIDPPNEGGDGGQSQG